MTEPAKDEVVVMNLRESRRTPRKAKAVDAKDADVTKITKTADAAKKAVAKKAGMAPAVAKAAKPKLEPVVKGPDNPWYTRSSFVPREGCLLYEAVGTSGQIAVRSYRTPVTHAVNLSDDSSPRAEYRAGTIYHMYASEAEAEKVAERLRSQGYGATIVPVQPYRGQGETK